MKVLPAAKANWLLAVQRILASEGCGCDIYSPGELSAALDASIDPRYISVNGVPKDREHIYRAVQVGARITIDSVEEVDGRSCYGDRLMPTVPVPHVEVGDVLAMLDTGAYQEVSTINFNAMPRPSTVLVTGDRATVIRRRETEEDVFRRDVVPDHLRPGGPLPVPRAHETDRLPAVG